jgi:hypothetical protein
VQRQHAHGIARRSARRGRAGTRLRRVLDCQHAIEAVDLYQRQPVGAQHALQRRQHRLTRHRAAGLRGDHRLHLAVDDIVKMQLIAEDLAHHFAHIRIDEIEADIAVGGDVDASGARRRRGGEDAGAGRHQRARSALLPGRSGGLERRRRGLGGGRRRRDARLERRPRRCRAALRRTLLRRAAGQQQGQRRYAGARWPCGANGKRGMLGAP